MSVVYNGKQYTVGCGWTTQYGEYIIFDELQHKRIIFAENYSIEIEQGNISLCVDDCVYAVFCPSNDTLTISGKIVDCKFKLEDTFNQLCLILSHNRSDRFNQIIGWLQNGKKLSADRPKLQFTKIM